jgi:hypothetical protein
MFLRAKTRLKDGKEHRYWSIVANRRTQGGRVALRQRGQALFHVGFEALLYDLTSTYFGSDPPQGGLRKFGYSRDKRPDCVQVVIALVVTPKGLPLAYEVMPGHLRQDHLG